MEDHHLSADNNELLQNDTLIIEESKFSQILITS